MNSENDSNRNSWKETIISMWEDILIFLELIFVFVKMFFSLLEDIFQKLFPPEQETVAGKIVLITGTGHGIGRELALQYAALGGTVVGLDINMKNNEATMRQIDELGYPKAYAYLCDISSRKNVMQVAGRVIYEVGHVNILINNAGILYAKSFFQQSEEMIEKTFRINVMGHFWTMQAFLPDMLRKKCGHIVAISSCSGLIGVDNCTAYSASKFAVRGLMESLYNELYDKTLDSGINLTTVYPFVVNTGMCKSVRIRFKNVLPFLHSKYVAAKIISAQRRRIIEISLPEYIITFNTIMRLLPMKSILHFYNFADIGLDNEL